MINYIFQLERTALHYAMGVPSVEVLSNILIKAGAKRIIKDLVSHVEIYSSYTINAFATNKFNFLNFQKSRQPSYYFMNKSDIERLQEEEKSA